jgi:hypothetical protein
VPVLLRRAGGALLVVALLGAAVPAAAGAANRVPVCHGTTTAVAPGGERAFTLRCEDRDGPQPLQVTVVDPPDHGTLEAVDGLRLTFAPASGHTGADSFAFRVSDGENASAVHTQQVRVTNENLAPLCLPLRITAVNQHAYVEAPCYDPNEGDAVIPAVAAPPAHGEVRSDGQLSYAAEPDYLGPDSFGLQATDGTLTGPATAIEVDVVPREPPVCETPPTLPVRTGTAKSFSPVCRDNTGFASPMLFSYTVVDAPDHGQLDGLYGGFTYTPHAGYQGSDSYTLRPSNSAGAGPSITVPIVVADDANEPPRCSAWGRLRLRSGSTRPAPTSCWDPDGDALTTVYDPAPAHGAIAEGSFPVGSTYTADDRYSGPDVYGVRARDGRAQSATVEQRVTIVGDGENTVPECRPSVTRVRNDRMVNISVACPDAEHDAVDILWGEPEHGTIQPGGTGPWGEYAAYTPPADFAGIDRLTFRGRDDHGGETVPMTVLVQVEAVEAPTCRTPARRSARTGGSIHLTITCVANDEIVHPRLHVAAQHGTVHGYGYGSFSYEPADGFAGVDSFTVRAENSAGYADAVQEIEVGPDVNTVPSCWPHYNAVTRAAPITLDVSCYDEEGDPVTVSTVAGPAHGELGPWDQAGHRIAYTPDAGFTGDDAFTFRASDGRGESAIVTQQIRVRTADANDVPRCIGFGTGTDPGKSVSFWAHCTDGDGDPLTLAIARQPEHGTVQGPDAWGTIVYTPDAGFTGTDTIGITASDGRATSPVAEVQIIVGSTASQPRCTPLAANVEHDGSRRVQLRCVVLIEAPVAPEIVDGPDHGTLGPIDAGGWVTYTPERGFSGTDSFTYRGVHDGVQGAPATVELRVAAPAAGGEPAADPAVQQPLAAGPAPIAPPPLVDPVEQAAERRLGGDAVPAPGLRLGDTRAFVPAAARRGVLTVDGASEKLVALVCATACTVGAQQRIALGATSPRAAAARPIRLRAQRLRLRAGQAGVVVLRLTRAQRRSVRRARRATLTLTLAVRDASGGTVRGVARFRLKAR